MLSTISVRRPYGGQGGKQFGKLSLKITGKRILSIRTVKNVPKYLTKTADIFDKSHNVAQKLHENWKRT